ncbi:hypothetical protein MMC07_006065 [Pseudocyphellaria aurata]|nr:hypothetical protein [Pseudocyphellaria aurata]
MPTKSTSSDSKLCLPGYGIPLHRAAPHWPKKSFPNALSRPVDSVKVQSESVKSYGLNASQSQLIASRAALDDTRMAPLTTQIEFIMLMIMDRITDKLGWEEKVFNEDITNKWRVELVRDGHSSIYANAENDGGSDEGKQKDQANIEQAGRIVPEEVRREGAESDATDRVEISMITDKVVDWCFAELKYKAELLKKIGCVESLDGIFKSDTVISNDLREALIEAVAPLENVPASVKDWHPWSRNQVLDLVHPSMYPLVYGQSKIVVDRLLDLNECISRCGDGETLGLSNVPIDDNLEFPAWSRKFQWLPSEFEVPAGGQDVRIVSYINNLYPQSHQNLYSVIEQVVAKAIPLWNQTLTPLNISPYVPPRVEMKGYGYEGFDDVNHEYPQGPKQASDEEDGDYFDRWLTWMDSRKVVHPQPEQFKPPGERFNEKYGDYQYEDQPLVDLRKDFGRLQIIVKLATIHLTPEDPNYDGGSWHVEGQLNENITALYYYETVNITESRLSFRRKVDPLEDINYEQSDFRAVEQIYGIESDGPSIQEIGHVVAKEGRLLTFPNTLQHRVAPFRLSDPTKPGHRKILALFLIDPHRPIISTAHVPCQQKDAWANQVRNVEPLSLLPSELVDQILNVRLHLTSLAV